MSSFTRVLTEDFVQLDFQLPPTKKVRSAVEAATTESDAAERRWNRRGEIGEIIDALSDEDEAAAPELPRAHSEGCCCCAAIAGARAAAIRQGMMPKYGGKRKQEGGRKGGGGKGKKK